MSEANKRQVGGQHYSPGAEFQHWDFTVRCLQNRYLEGMITKYVARHAKKNGEEDLRKAEHYLQKLAEELAAGRVEPLIIVSTFTGEQLTALDNFTRSMAAEEAAIINAVVLYAGTATLAIAAMRLERLRQRCYGPTGAAAQGGAVLSQADATGPAAVQAAERRVPRHLLD